jgi:hypothetical protein
MADSKNSNGQWTDKCISEQSEDGTDRIACGAKGDDQEHGALFSGEAKKECRAAEEGNKCSSSQTENGDLGGNRFKKECFDGSAVQC